MPGHSVRRLPRTLEFIQLMVLETLSRPGGQVMKGLASGYCISFRSTCWQIWRSWQGSIVAFGWIHEALLSEVGRSTISEDLNPGSNKAWDALDQP